MRMQNASMEFVTFDAQDVIMTSGTPMAWFKVTQSLVKDSTGYNTGIWQLSGGGQLILMIDNNFITGEPYVQLTGGVSGQSYSAGANMYNIINAKEATADTIEGDQLFHLLPDAEGDIASVIGWLIANGKQ